MEECLTMMGTELMYVMVWIILFGFNPTNSVIHDAYRWFMSLNRDTSELARVKRSCKAVVNLAKTNKAWCNIIHNFFIKDKRYNMVLKTLWMDLFTRVLPWDTFSVVWGTESTERMTLISVEHQQHLIVKGDTTQDGHEALSNLVKKLRNQGTLSNLKLTSEDGTSLMFHDNRITQAHEYIVHMHNMQNAVASVMKHL